MPAFSDYVYLPHTRPREGGSESLNMRLCMCVFRGLQVLSDIRFEELAGRWHRKSVTVENRTSILIIQACTPTNTHTCTQTHID